VLRFVDCTIKLMEDEDGARHESRSSGLLHVEASWASVSQSSIKICGCATVGSARGTIIEIV
jgi:hypothetical protein